MNILLVNTSHPEVQHVSAVRAWRFSNELAHQGHRVVLLCTALPGREEADTADWEGHDWSAPLVIAPVAKVVRPVNRRNKVLQRVETMFRMISCGGYQSAWIDDAFLVILSKTEVFNPDVIWVTFGEMEAVFLAKRLASKLKVPWVLDLKDNWSLFVPRGLRRIMAWRTKGCAAVTANAELTSNQGEIWQGQRPKLIYSGVDQVYFTRQEVQTDKRQFLPINLIGALYFEQSLKTLLDGILLWSRQRPKGSYPISLTYYGSNTEQFLASTATLQGQVLVKTEGYVAPPVLAAACQSSAGNIYVGHPGTFHHKTLELLACGRPLLVCPSDGDESRRLVARVSGLLLEAATRDEVAAACEILELRWTSEGAGLPNRATQEFSWSNQTKLLEGVFIRVVGDGASSVK